MIDINSWFCTVFPADMDEMPQDFNSYAEAEEYANERFGKGRYTIESPCGLKDFRTRLIPTSKGQINIY